jgi:cation efflux family protein
MALRSFAATISTPLGMSPTRIEDRDRKIEDELLYLDPSGRDESNRRRAIRAILFSSLGLLATSAFELFITILSGSVALLSDALHNLGDVFTTVGVYFGFRASKKLPTCRYPYGYGRPEDLAGVAIVAAIWSSAVLAGWRSYDKLVSGRGTTHLGLGMVAAAIGIVGNQPVARYKLNVGREIKSGPLMVDARHSWLDAVASAGALVGLSTGYCRPPKTIARRTGPLVCLAERCRLECVARKRRTLVPAAAGPRRVYGARVNNAMGAHPWRFSPRT